MRTPFAVMAVLGAVLLGLSALLGEGGGPPAAAGGAPAPVAVIAQRVAAIRGLRFDLLPEPVSVSPEQARREGLEDLDRSYPEGRRRADEEVLKLLELVEPDVDLRVVSATTFSEGVAGYYDPRAKRLRTVQGAATGSRVLAEMILAHELDHALEDQRFGLGLEDEEGGSDDASLARLALVEGSATALMYRYVEKHFTQEEAFAGALSGAFADTAALPPFLEAQLVWPYVGGQRFADVLLERAGGRWDLVDLALRTRPPATTEQVLHPEKYFQVESASRVRLRVGPLLGGGYSRTSAGTSGEFQTREILAAAGGGGSAEAAEGWGGDRYELWQPAGGSCAAPCRERSVLVLRWVWDTPRDEREFVAKLRQWVADGLEAQPAGEGAWTLDGGAVAVARRGGAVSLALAPREPLARRLAASR